MSEKKGFFASLFSGSGIDLDLGCLYELKDGRKGAVQALGNAFGSLNQPPYISLDGDDRTGAAAVANWQQADATVTIKYPGAEDLVVKMDSYNSSNIMCGLALLENVNDETFSVEKLVQFYPGHEALDRAYNWGMSWRAGHK